MARLERPTNETTNPTTKFLEWKSKEKCFSFYNKENKENVLVKLPLKVLFLEHYHTVKGWHDKSESGIYSNEVYSIGKEPLNVRAFKGGEVAEGLYKEIKDSVHKAGGKYHRSIYVMDAEGNILNLSLRGTAVASYSEFYKDNHHLLDNQFIEVNEALDGKKGSIKYSFPKFTVGEVISREVDNLANESAKVLQSYVNEYNHTEDKVQEAINNDAHLEAVDLDNDIF